MQIPRRAILQSSIFGLLSVPSSQILFAIKPFFSSVDKKPHSRYPSIEADLVEEIVGVSHFNLERLKELVDPRPELSKSCWDWGFGDVESAIGAASHVARKDIVDYLLSKGARPTLFTFAMLGAYHAVKSTIEFYPGVQRILGPHGFSLIDHVRFGIGRNASDPEEAQKLLDYLEEIGDADGPEYRELKEEEKEKYLGDYKYGPGETDGFSVRLNMRKMLSLGKLGKFGGALLKTGEHVFSYNGAPSVKIKFHIEQDAVTALTITEPFIKLKAVKV